MTTRLYPTYAKDVLSFLSYVQLQECRFLSHSINATILAHPVSISARRRFQRLYLKVGSAEEFGSPSNDEDGYAETLLWSARCRLWKQVQAEWGCCREGLEELAETLTGERIIPSQPADSLVRLWIHVDSRPYCHTTVVFTARNKVTSETAFGVLHLLDHLRHVYLPYYYSENRADGGDMALNPSIIKLLSGGYGRAYKLNVGSYFPEVLPDSVHTFVADVAHLKIGLLCWQDPLDTDVVFGFALQARLHCKRILLEYQTNDTINAALQYFQKTAPQIGREVVNELILCRHHSVIVDSWPTDLTPKREMERLGCPDERGDNLYQLPGGMSNANSGDRFDVLVACVVRKDVGDDERETLTEMRFRFR